ncbi:P-loop containing nucleoside triphosphate hydrolase protein [Pisolithus croceorrhizus]|nr:P-loop containing nucleoside triphosphate hydrolase protein [Pisolithus croceorrhizus]
MYHLLKGLHEYLTRKEEFSVIIIGLDWDLNPLRLDPTVGQNIYVIDAQDRERLGEGWEVFDSVLSAPQILNVPLLLLANKQDSPDSENVQGGGFGEDEDAELERRRQRIASLDVMGISALDGQGVREAVDWLFLRVQNSRR